MFVRSSEHAPTHSHFTQSLSPLYSLTFSLPGPLLQAANNIGRTPLHLACELNRIEAVELLLRNGANTHASTSAEWTPLHFSTAYGHDDVVTLLLDNEYCKPVYVEAVNSLGQTARDLTTSKVIYDRLDALKREFQAQHKWDFSLRILMVLVRFQRKFKKRRRDKMMKRFNQSDAMSDEARSRRRGSVLLADAPPFGGKGMEAANQRSIQE